jgi:hypothetical protein
MVHVMHATPNWRLEWLAQCSERALNERAVPCGGHARHSHAANGPTRVRECGSGCGSRARGEIRSYHGAAIGEGDARSKGCGLVVRCGV